MHCLSCPPGSDAVLPPTSLAHIHIYTDNMDPLADPQSPESPRPPSGPAVVLQLREHRHGHVRGVGGEIRLHPSTDVLISL